MAALDGWEAFESTLIHDRYSIRDPKDGSRTEKTFEDVAKRIQNHLMSREFPIDMNIVAEAMEAMVNRRLTMATPALMNLGNPYAKRKGYYSCFPLGRVPDTTKEILKYKDTCTSIFQYAGGAGLDISALRPEGAPVDNFQGESSGAVSFIRMFTSVADVIAAGGKRRGAMLGQMDWNHPDIEKFIRIKKDNDILSSINLSVNAFGDFFKQKDLIRDIAYLMWENGDPGLLFPDEMASNSPYPKKLKKKARYVNPCVVGDTILRSPTGDFKIKDLVDGGIKELPVYCCDPNTGELAIRIGRNPRKTGVQKKVYKVTYYGGNFGEESITVTDNHNFLLRDLSKIQTKDLKPGMRLLPFSKYSMKQGKYPVSEMYVGSGENVKKESHVVMEWMLNKDIDWGNKRGQYHVHHKDGNHVNNHPDNLELILGEVHVSNHSRGKNNSRLGVEVSDETRELMSLAGMNWRLNKGINYKDTCLICNKPIVTCKTNLSVCSDECKDVWKKSRKELRDQKLQSRQEEYVEKVKHKCPHCDNIVLTDRITCGSKECKTKQLRTVSSDKRRKAVVASTKSKALTLGTTLLSEGYDISNPKLWDSFRNVELKWGPYHRVSSKAILNHYENWLSFLREVQDHNHIVKSIEFIGYEDVYNITVDEHHTVAWQSIFTFQCAEYTSLPFSSCNLLTGSLLTCNNVDDIERLGYLMTALGNCILWITINNKGEGLPLDAPHISEFLNVLSAIRPVGVGLTGVGEYLYKNEMDYSNIEAHTNIFKALTRGSLKASAEWAEATKQEAEWDPDYKKSHLKIIEYDGPAKFWNTTTTCQAPAGSVSQFLRCVSTGIEPLAEFKIKRHFMGTDNKLHPVKLESLIYKEGMKIPPPVSAIDQMKVTAALQSILHTSASKTINLPNEATVEEIEQLIHEAPGLGLKGLTVFRHGCKRESIVTSQEEKKAPEISMKRPGVLSGNTYKFTGQNSLYVTVNLDRGMPREVFVTAGRSGKTVHGLVAGMGRLLSLCLKSGTDPKDIIKALGGDDTGDFLMNDDLGRCTSMPEAIARALNHSCNGNGVSDKEPGDWDICPQCTKLTLQRLGTCNTCSNCNYTSC